MASSSPVQLALLGAGSMGANHARVIAASSRARLKTVVDHNIGRASRLAEISGCTASSDVEAAFRCDAAIVATPTDVHVEQATQLISAGCPLLIEKPIATNPRDVRRILDESRRHGVPITCGFVERFNPAVMTALSLVETTPLHFLSIRHSPATPRIATSVVFDLLIHDVDLAFRVAGASDVVTLSSALKYPEDDVAEIADCIIEFAGGMLATLSASRYSQRKIRSLFVTTEQSLIEIDLLRADVSVYRNVRQEQLTEGGTTYRAETIVDIPFVRHAGEPLALQLEGFLDLLDGTADADLERSTLLPPHDVAARVEGSLAN
jgi:predicted dehydrogenase